MRNVYTDLTYLKRFPNRRNSTKGKLRISLKGNVILEYLCYTLVALGFDLFIIFLVFFG